MTSSTNSAGVFSMWDSVTERITSGRLRFCVVAWLVQRVVVEGIGIALVAAFGVPSFSRPGPFGTFFNWDSGYFACIAKSGYFGPACADGATTNRFAFFPLYPLASRGVAWVIGLGEVRDPAITVGMWLVAATGSFVAVLALYSVVSSSGDERLAQRSVILFLAGPYSLFLVASYSESLYLAAAILAWWACLQRRWILCAVFGMAATASRASGLFLIPALLVLCLTGMIRTGRPLRLGPFIAVASGGLGVLAFWGFLGARTGDPLAWSHAQTSGWNRRTEWPWQTAANQVIHMLREPRWDWQVQTWLESLCAVGLLLAVLWFVRHRHWAEAALVGLTALSLMTSTSYLSLGRNTVTLFPLVWLLATVTRGSRRRFVITLTVCLLLLVFNVVQFASGRWAD